MDRDSTYWTFSAAAQAVGAFAALLLAAYALVHGVMESSARQDDSLAEIHRTLRRTYYFVLAALAVATAFAVLSCLLVVYLNAYTFSGQNFLKITAALFVVLSVGGGVFFVLLVIDPRRYERTARRMAESQQVTTVAGAPAAEFFQLFVILERRIRELYERHLNRLDIGSYEAIRPSVRHMLDALIGSEVIPGDLQSAIRKINEQRNLIFHGRVEDVDPKLVDELKAVTHALSQIR